MAYGVSLTMTGELSDGSTFEVEMDAETTIIRKKNGDPKLIDAAIESIVDSLGHDEWFGEECSRCGNGRHKSGAEQCADCDQQDWEDEHEEDDDDEQQD